MGNSFTLLYDYRTAGFPFSGGHLILAFLCLAGLLLVGLGVYPGTRKAMQNIMDSLPVRIPYLVFAVVYFLIFAGVFGWSMRGAYIAHKDLLAQMDEGSCRTARGLVSDFSRRAIAARTTTIFVRFKVDGIRFRYTSNSIRGYHDVDGPLKNGTEVRIIYCGRGRIIARLEARL